MSADNFLTIKSAFLPYSDGSGHKVAVEIVQVTEESEPTISIKEIYKVTDSEWADVVNGIYRMQRAIPARKTS